MKAKLKDAMKEAMKAKEKVKLQAIRGLLSALQYEEMQKGVDELPEAGAIAVLQTELKKRKESLEYAEKDGREDQINDINEEIALINSFLPQQLSEQELEQIIGDLKSADEGLNMGGAMKALKENYAGQYDGKLASSIAKKVLG